MRKILIAVLVYAFAPLFSYGQNCKDPFLGSKTLYQSQQEKYSVPPKGYLPVFINHVGRHGARHLTKDVNTAFIYTLLLQADSANGLSDKGKSLKEKILRLERIELGNVKSITAEGKSEQHGLADRAYDNYSNVFDVPKPVIHITYTKEIRTAQTSDAFLMELKTKINEPLIIKQLNDTTLRFYDLSPTYLTFKETGDWLKHMQQLKTSVKYNEVAKEVSQQFFSAAYFKTVNQKDQQKITSDLFGFVTIFYSLKKEVEDAGYTLEEVDMKPFLSCTQLSLLAKVDNAEDFYLKGPGEDINGIQVKIALPLLADFIRSTDDYIKNKSVNAQLRFCHAETIAPYATLLGLTTSLAPGQKGKSIDSSWDAASIIPLSSNIQWILYQKQGSENYLIKFLLNEKEMAVAGLATKTFPYYNWDNVRSFYMKIMQGFNVSLTTNFSKYLQEVK